DVLDGRSGNMTARSLPGSSSLSFQYAYDANAQVRQAAGSAGRRERYFYDHRHRRFLSIGSDGSWRFSLGDAYEVDHTAQGVEEANAYVYVNGAPIARLTSATCAGQACQSLVSDVTV